jgi:hypothetical protein
MKLTVSCFHGSGIVAAGYGSSQILPGRFLACARRSPQLLEPEDDVDGLGAAMGCSNNGIVVWMKLPTVAARGSTKAGDDAQRAPMSTPEERATRSIGFLQFRGNHDQHFGQHEAPQTRWALLCGA